MGERRTIRWHVRGRVQGVGFRWFVDRVAGELAVDGDVYNLVDGGVEIRATGSDTQLEALLLSVRKGPRGSRVDDVEVLPPEGGPFAKGFQIRF